jgi:uncharacterized membrane protein
MRAILFIIAYIFYAYIMINMIIDIEDFGDFLFFIFIGSVLMAIVQFVVGAIIIAITPDE